MITTIKGNLQPSRNITVSFRRNGNGPKSPAMMFVDSITSNQVYLAVMKGESEPYELYAAMKLPETFVEQSLGDRPVDRLLAELIQLLDHENPRVRRFAVLCLRHTVTGKDGLTWEEYEPDEQKFLTKWRSWWDDNCDSVVRSSLDKS